MCSFLVAEFGDLLAWIAVGWALATGGLAVATSHPYRGWIAVAIVTVLPAVTWLLTVDTPHLEMNGFGAMLGWAWGVAAAAGGWAAARPHRERLGQRARRGLRLATGAALAVAVLSPLATPVIESLARERAERRLIVARREERERRERAWRECEFPGEYSPDAAPPWRCRAADEGSGLG